MPSLAVISAIPERDQPMPPTTIDQSTIDQSTIDIVIIKADSVDQTNPGRFFNTVVHDYGCEIEPGLEKVHLKIDRRMYFSGQCYSCGAYGHNQNFCPLQLCLDCRKYGHHFKVCR